MSWWSQFDRAEVAADFARIAAAGLDSVRVFLTWEDFQPAPNEVDPEMLERLVAVADLAGALGLALVPTLFTGHMSGVELDSGVGTRRFGWRWSLPGRLARPGREKRASQLVRRSGDQRCPAPLASGGRRGTLGS
jgi:hypothetical protein